MSTNEKGKGHGTRDERLTTDRSESIDGLEAWYELFRPGNKKTRDDPYASESGMGERGTWTDLLMPSRAR